MFGMGMGEILLILVVALLALGPDKLPAAAKAIGKGIRDLRRQTHALTETLEHDTKLGEAVREIKSALREDPTRPRPPPTPPTVSDNEPSVKEAVPDDDYQSDAEAPIIRPPDGPIVSTDDQVEAGDEPSATEPDTKPAGADADQTPDESAHG